MLHYCDFDSGFRIYNLIHNIIPIYLQTKTIHLFAWKMIDAFLKQINDNRLCIY